MTASNIEIFNDLTGRILGKLYLDFPMPSFLAADHFVEAATAWNEKCQMDLPSKDAEIFIATAQWLIRAGYIHGQVIPYTHVSDAVLTAKGLEVLNAIPKSLVSGPSLGEQLAEAAKEGGKETVKGLVNEALGLGARIFGPMIGIP
ncbi:hypothetical protein HBN84_04870 [Pseudomonas lundensis]|uniref:hypothetical protein n=1 Tax=Pseudomonas lundensis TaxID=86185 RepID=UPI001473523B|nr:hypothetical protein [Pseudomonas lundensis]NNA24639.1 hypothetical protein [Pseudomonas lundensis]